MNLQINAKMAFLQKHIGEGNQLSFLLDRTNLHVYGQDSFA